MTVRAASDDQLLGTLQHELSTATSWALDHLQEDQLKALQYYLGMPLGNEVKGRSQVVSWDVFEAVESAMPGFIEPFFSGERIGTFEPRGPEDEAYSEQATDYTNYVIKARNEGFSLFCTWFKDALLSKIGVVRADWSPEDPKRKELAGLLPEQLTALAQDTSVQIIEHSAKPLAPGQVVHDVTFLQQQPGCVKIENVRPENFVVTSGVGSMEKARLIGEWVTYTRGELKQLGFKQYAEIKSYEIAVGDGELELARDGALRGLDLNDDAAEPALEEVRLFKGFLRCDRNGDGIAEWRRVLVGSGESPILEDEEADGHNYAVITPIQIPHRVVGLSYADVARPIHELKTVLTRQYLDSLYLANRPRTYVNLNADVSLDDVLSDRIGGIIRGRGPAGDAVQPLQTTAVARDALEGLQLADTMRETRLGIPKFNPGLEADALHKTATGVRSINNLVDKRQKMVLRQFAETGVKQLFRLVLRLLTQYQDVPALVRLRGQFVPFDPRGWNPDMDCVIEVGVGTSDETETMMMLQQFGQFMTWAQQSGSGVVQPQNVYEFGKALARNARLKGADQRLLTDPSMLPPQQPPQDPKLVLEQFKAQQEQMRFQAEAQLEQQRRSAEAQMQMATDSNRQEMEARQKQLELQQQAQLEAMRIASNERVEAQRLEFERWKAEFEAQTKLSIEAAKAQAQQVDLSPIVERMQALEQYISAPPRIVRDQTGNAVGVEKGGVTFAVERDNAGRPAGLVPKTIQ